MGFFRIYIDEVGNNDLKSSIDVNHRYLSLTGVIFDTDYAGKFLTPKIEELKVKHFGSHPDEPVILHRKEIINYKFPFHSLKDEKKRKEFSIEFLNFLDLLDFKVITVIIDKLEHSKKYEIWKYDPYHYCLEVITERFYFFLKENNGNGDLMIESRGGKEDKRLKKSFRRIMDEGTNFIKPDLLNKLITSKELKVKPKYLNISGLQIADLIAYPSRQYIFYMKGLQEKKRETFNDEIIKIIRNKYYTKLGNPEGYGIKVLP